MNFNLNFKERKKVIFCRGENSFYLLNFFVMKIIKLILKMTGQFKERNEV
jgi:hypothetical protein